MTTSRTDRGDDSRQHSLLVDLDTCLERLREEGLKLTSQRRAIIELFIERPTHMTAQEVYGLLEDAEPGLSRATVYNNLDVFTQLGLLNRLVSQDGQTYFDPNLSVHHHARCAHCGEIFDVHVAPERLDALLSSVRLTPHTPGGTTRTIACQRASIWLDVCCAGCVPAV